MRVPKNWNKIPLENFIHYLEYKDEDPQTLEEKFDLIYKRTCAILGCSVEEAKGLTVQEQKDLVKLMSTPLPDILPLQFKHEGTTYRPIIQAKKLSGARYAGIKDAAKRGVNNNLYHILFLVSQPVKFGFRKKFPFIGWKEYDFKPEEMGDKIKEFKTLPMEVANPISIFFLTLSKNLKDLLEDYSIQTLNKMTKDMSELQEDLENDMAGLQ